MGGVIFRRPEPLVMFYVAGCDHVLVRLPIF
ncbi:Uncharacterised protein [Vibrio cholerae]|nr:Uncharacterised protein [Vibrio cholerae]CSI51481.1 Uncharacterised protein [Vibrio cholerae]